jgi:aminoacylase
MEALHRIVAAGGQPRRTVHITVVPDEEIGGAQGLGEFVAQGHFDALNVGVALDEGLANPLDQFTVFFAERAVWWVEIRAKGPTGHGSRFVKNTAIERLLKAVNHFLECRAENEAKLDGHGCTHATKLLLGDVTTINCTMLDAGVSMDGGKTHALNVIPDEARAGFDIRVPPSVPLEDMEALVRSWTEPYDVDVHWVFKTPSHVVSETDVAKNPWWGIFTDTFDEIKMAISPEVFPAGTDSRYIRMKGVPAFGFSPMRDTEVLLHDHNERLSRKVFLEGVAVFERVISRLANADRLKTEEGLDFNF